MDNSSDGLVLNINPFWNVNKNYLFLLIIGFIITSAIGMAGLMKNIDSYLLLFFEKIRSGNMDLLMIIITTISDTINLIIIGFILTIIKKTRIFGLLLLISLITITIIVTYVKPLFGINHPVIDFKPLVVLPDKFSLEKDSFMPFAQNFSYPSNHLASATAFSFISAGLLYFRFPLFSKIFFFFFPGLIGFTKLYLYQQNLVDIIGGCFLGLIVAAIFIKLLKDRQDAAKLKI